MNQAPFAVLVEKIKNSVHLVSLVSQYVVLRASGVRHVGLCPFHSERTPSFMVHEVKQFYYCYGCKQGGDAIHFMMQIQGLSFQEALEELGEQLGIPLPEKKEEKGKDPKEREGRAHQGEEIKLAYKLNRFVANYYHQQLKQQKQDYFQKRGVSSEMERLFYLGSSAQAWEDLALHLVQTHAPLDFAEKLGLIHRSSSQKHSRSGFFDLFRGRALFPILTLRGQVAGFGGRAYQIEGEEGKKYLNSPESLVFQKSKLVFGLYQAQKFIREADEVILVEGYFDVLALHSIGIQNVVALCGTALSGDHLQALRRLASKITLLFDGDRAGIQATERAMEFGLERGVTFYGCQIPGEKDPDEWVQEPGGPEQLKALLSRTNIPLLDQRMIQLFEKSQEGPEVKVQAIQQVAGWLQKMTDRVGKEVRIREVCERFQISPSLLQTAMGKIKRSPAREKEEGLFEVLSQSVLIKKREALPSEAEGGGGPSPLDRRVLMGLFQQEECRSLFLNCLKKEGLPKGKTPVDLFESSAVREWARSWMESFPVEQWGDVISDRLFQPVVQKELKTFLVEIFMEVQERVEWIDFKISLSKLMKRLWMDFSDQLSESLKKKEFSSQFQVEFQTPIMKEYLDVQKKIKELNSL